MGTTANLANAALRDYVIDGNAGSGTKNPVKADVRAIFTDADTRLGAVETAVAPVASQATTLAAHSTHLTTIDGEITAINSTFATNGSHLTGIDGEITAINSTLATNGSHLTTIDGEITAINSTLANNGSHLTGIDAEITTIDNAIAANSNNIASLQTSVAVTTDRMRMPRIVANRQRLTIIGNYTPAATNIWWAVGVTVTHAVASVDHITLFPADYGAVVQFVLDVYSRPLASGDTGQPPAAPADTLITSQTYNIVDLIKADGERVAAKGFDFSIALPVSLDVSHIYWFKLSALNGSGAPVNFGMSNGQAGLVSPVWARGWFAASISGVTTSTGLAGTATIPYELYEVVGGPIDDSRLVNGSLDDIYGVTDLLPHQSFGLTAILPELVLDRAQGSLHIPPSGLTFATPSTDTVTNEAITLLYNQAQNLAHQFIGAGSVVVHVTSGGALLVEGTDYSIDYDMGQITGIKNVASFAVQVSYTGYNSRYDLVVADAFTGALSIVAGTARGSDMNEYSPTALATDYFGKVPLYTALVTVNRGIDVIPVHQFSGSRRNKDRGRFVDWLESSRQRLPRLMKKLRAGSAITLAGYGTSITDMGGGAPAGGGGTYDWYTPNGQYRDTLIFFQAGRLKTDTIAAIPLFDHSDGGGTIHHHLGFNWRLKAAMESRFSSTVTYKNMGIGGSTSDPSIVNGVPGGAYGTRLSALTSLSPDVVVIEFGMNELGSTLTYINLVATINNLKTICDVIVMGVPAVAKNGSLGSQLDQWRFTNNEIMRAAEYTKVAYVPTMEICDPANIGGMGISWQTTAETNGINHPGPYELGKYGDLLAQIIP